MAVAINVGLTLLTSDEKILTWPGQLARMDTRGEVRVRCRRP